MIKKIYQLIFPLVIRRLFFLFRAVLLNPKRIFVLNDNNSYNEGGLATNHIVDFLKDENFVKNFTEASKNNDFIDPSTNGWRYRAYINKYFAEYVLKKFENDDGDFIELGTGRAVFAKLIFLSTDLKDHKNRKFYLFDTFKRTSHSALKDDDPNVHFKKFEKLKIDHIEGDYSIFVQKKLSNFKNFELVKGKLPSTLDKKLAEINKVIFLHIELNDVYSEIESIKLIYDKLAKGSVVIIEKYCYSEVFREQKNAWDDFIKSKNNIILSLPTGQGVFFKI
mgnify:CR=1 FL=1